VEQRFVGRTAVVTGAASGIGAAIARRLCEEGASVVGADLNGPGLDEMEEELQSSFAGVVTDVTNEDDVATMVATAAGRFGALHAAFNVAGGGRGGAIVDLTEEDWDFTVDLVLKGTYLCTKHEARQMRDARVPGAIVNISSVNAFIPLFGGSNYAAGKAGVEMFTRNAALELAPAGIRVNAVLPGLVETPATEPFLDIAALRQDFVDRILVGRPASTWEIAGPALYLASEEASYVTGASLIVDGGWGLTGYPDLGRYATGST
jgi:NAD(P)-dependent dehydrogenase (short-subunit alcohol dehydrogenase family)